MALTDADLIAASLREPARFATVFDRHYGAIFAYLARRIDRAAAEEVASETFVLAFGARDRYDAGHADARPWLFGIATNLLRRHARGEERRRRAYARALERDETAGELDTVLARADAALGATAVADAVARLTASDRDTLLLFALTDLDYDAIAIATGVPVGTVRSRLHRARRHVQAALAEETSTERSRI